MFLLDTVTVLHIVICYYVLIQVAERSA